MKNTVHLIDCMDFMKDLPDNAYDLAIVDPPYGIGVKTNMGRRAGVRNDNPPAKWDDESPSVEYYNELRRISRNQIVWGANHFISKMPIDSACWLMWDKGFSHDVSFAQFELAWTSLDGTCKKFDLSPNQIGRIHPTQKPIALYKWILQNYAKPGQIIFDSHVGSGSIRIACHDFGFDFEGCEIDEDYWEAQEERYKRHAAQGELFGADEIQRGVFE